MSESLSKQYPVWSTVKPFVLGGGAGCFATCCIQPIDMVKVRIQLQGEGGVGPIIRNPVVMGTQIMRSEGFFGLYKGLSAALLRQMTYGTTRLGLFRTLTNRFSEKDGSMTFVNRVLASVVAGGVGALVGTPADAALVRIQSDSTLPPEKRRGYKNVVDALYRMLKEEGLVKGVFAGASPTIIRALALNVGMLVTYDPAKDYLNPILGKGTAANLAAGAFSGVCASATSLPFDFIKTRLQKQTAGPDGKMPYSGFVDCFTKVVAKEGPFSLYNGFMTYCIRIAPHIMITWATLEYLNSIQALK